MDALFELPKNKVIDARQAWGAPKHFNVVEGPNEVNTVVFQSQNNNTQNLTFNITVPSLDTGVVRGICYHIQGVATFSGTVTSPKTNLFSNASSITSADTEIALSDECIDQVIANESVQFGSKQNNLQRAVCGVELARINNPSYSGANFRSGSGGQYHDFATEFSPWIGTNSNPLANVSNVNQSDHVPRTRTESMTILTNTSTSATVSFDLHFFSSISPFTQAELQQPAMRGLENIICKLNFQPNLLSLFSIPNNANRTSLSLASTVFNICEVAVQFITPSPNAVQNFMPIDDLYDYQEVQVWQSGNQTLPSGTPRAFNLQQISGSTIPDLFLIGVRQVQNVMTNQFSQLDGGASQPRWWVPLADLAGINLKMNNRTILNGFTQRQLYEMSLQNGLSQVTYPQFIGRNVSVDQTSAAADATSLILGGSFLVINPSRDMGISNDGICNGSSSNWTLSGSITVINQKATTTQPCELFVVAIYGGYAVSNGKFTADTGLIMPSEVISIFRNGQAPVSDANAIYHHRNGYNGGSVKSFLRDAGKKALNFLNENKEKIAKYALKGLENAAEKYGTGIDEEDEVGDLDTSNKALKNKIYLVNKYMKR